MVNIPVSFIHNPSHSWYNLVYSLRRNVSKKELENGYFHNRFEQLTNSFCIPIDSIASKCDFLTILTFHSIFLSSHLI